MADEIDFGIQLEEEKTNLISLDTVQNNISKVTLHKWQRDALEFFEKSNYNCIVECVTGGGKTFFAIEAIKKVFKINPHAKVLIVVPKNIILETGWYKELYECGIELSKIGVFYGRIKEFSQVTITNMQNLHLLDMKGFDMLVLDEIHNYGTDKLMKIFHDYNVFNYKLGLTATLERLDNKHWLLQKLFNYNLFKYTAEEALQDNVINSFKYISVGVEMDADAMDKYTAISGNINALLKNNGGYFKIMKDNTPIKYKLYELMNKRKQMVNNYQRKFDVARILINEHRNDKIICFNQFNSQTNKFYWELLDININAKILHSGVTQEERDKIIIDYKRNKFNVLLTTKVADEGVNIPAIDVAIIFAADSTKKQTIQRLGRCLRKKDKMSKIFVVYCVDTIEEKQNLKREKLFLDLAEDYRFMHYNLKGEMLCY
jgi:superfamily II DNA or RNA helicase